MRKTTKKLHDARLAAGREAIARAAAAAGGQCAMARDLGVTQAAVSKWYVRGWVPLPRAREIEALYGVPRTAVADPRVVDVLADTAL